jgi:hypothetical protein
MGSTTRHEDAIIGRRPDRRIRTLYGFRYGRTSGYGINRALTGSSTRNALRPAVSVT